MLSTRMRRSESWIAAIALACLAGGGAAALAQECESWKLAITTPTPLNYNSTWELLAYNPQDSSTLIVHDSLTGPKCYRWDGAQLTAMPAPAAVYLAPSMAYDAGRGVFVLKNYLGIEEFDGTKWEFKYIYPGGTPFSWGTLEIVYSTVLGILLTDGEYVLQYNGSALTVVNVIGKLPPKRSGHRLAFDSYKQRLVMFGGQASATGVYLNDTWEFLNNQWVQVTTLASPPAMTPHSFGMTYDLARGRIFLLSDTGKPWLYDGQNWSLGQAALPAAAGNKIFSSVSYHAATDSILLFGGQEDGNELWELERPNTIVIQPEDQTVFEGDTAFFVTYATGYELSYQWYDEAENPIPGQTFPALVLKNVNAKQAGNYICLISSPCGKLVSKPVTLTVKKKIQGDINGDGKVDQADLGILLANYGLP